MFCLWSSAALSAHGHYPFCTLILISRIFLGLGECFHNYISRKHRMDSLQQCMYSVPCILSSPFQSEKILLNGMWYWDQKIYCTDKSQRNYSAIILKLFSIIFRSSIYLLSPVVTAVPISPVPELTPVLGMVRLWLPGQDWLMRTWNLFSSIPLVWPGRGGGSYVTYTYIVITHGYLDLIIVVLCI